MADGKKQREKSPRGRLQRPNLDAFYNQRIADLHPGSFEFRILLVRAEAPKAERVMALDRATTILDWEDGGDTVSATLTLRRPFHLKPDSLPVLRGDGVRLEFMFGGRWRRLWDLKVMGDPGVNLASGEITCELGDDLYPLKKNERDWDDFKKSKKGAKRKGWTADEITRFVCRKERVRVGKLAKGTVRFELKKLKGMSGLEVIRRAWARERKETERKFITKMQMGKLQVLPVRRPGTLLVIKGIETEATVAGQAKQQRPATVIEAKGRRKGTSGKDGKLEVTVSRPKVVARLGRVVKEKDFGRVESLEDLRTQAKRYLAAQLKVQRTATISMPGVPFIEKGSTLKWLIEEPGWHGKTALAKRPKDRSFVFVTNASHSLSPTSHTTTCEVNQEDIYYEDAKQRDEAERKKKDRERKGRQTKKQEEGGE